MGAGRPLITQCHLGFFQNKKKKTKQQTQVVLHNKTDYKFLFVICAVIGFDCQQLGVLLNIGLCFTS